ncbi:MAG: glycosyltransferase [Rhodospirillaceae bacterium]
MEKRLAAHLQIANQVMVSRSEDQDTVRSIVPDQKVTVLRRGVERALFTPDKRDRAALQERFGIPENRPVILFAGRVDASKGAMTAVQAVRHLLDQGRDVHMILAGKGDDMDLAKDCLGGRLTAPGMVPQEDLAVLYASSDIFVFPSESETFGNVVLEARSSGLPVVVSGNPGGCSRFVAPDRTDGMVVTARDPQGWAHAIADLLEMDYPEMGRLARSRLEGERCGWRDVFDEDLLTVWEACVADYRRDPVGGSHP